MSWTTSINAMPMQSSSSAARQIVCRVIYTIPTKVTFPSLNLTTSGEMHKLANLHDRKARAWWTATQWPGWTDERANQSEGAGWKASGRGELLSTLQARSIGADGHAMNLRVGTVHFLRREDAEWRAATGQG